MAKITVEQVAVARISEETEHSMFALFSRFYADVEFGRFREDLHEKDECVLLRTGVCARGHGDAGRIVGFTTLRRERDPGPFGATYLFSGDTVLDDGCWGRRLLERAFFWTLLREKLRAPLRPLHWMLISKGFVTYLMMVRNFPSSYPRWDVATPPHLEERMERFYARRYGGRYRPETGLVHASDARGSVKGRLAVPKGAMLGDPDVQYFVHRNPRYGAGNELACVAEVRLRDFALHFATAFRRRRNRRPLAKRRERPVTARPITDPHGTH